MVSCFWFVVSGCVGAPTVPMATGLTASGRRKRAIRKLKSEAGQPETRNYKPETKLWWNMFRKLVLCLCLILIPAVMAMAQDKDKVDEKTKGKDAKELSGMSIVGNDEAPKSLYIVPWKSSEIGVETSLNMMLNDGDGPVDRDVFMRQLEFYNVSREKSSNH